jgi:hypothetical protein
MGFRTVNGVWYLQNRIDDHCSLRSCLVCDRHAGRLQVVAPDVLRPLRRRRARFYRSIG